jgi:hypothetical protein
MKRGFSRSICTAFAALCVLLISTAAFAAETEPATARLLYLSTGSWSADAIASNASPGATLRKSNCIGGLADAKTISFSADGAAILKDFAKLQCGSGADPLGIVDLQYSGSIELATEATYRDAAGNFNFVSIPPLTAEQLLPADDKNARLVLRRVSSIKGERSTFLAIVGRAWLTITFYSGDNPFLIVGTEVVNTTAGFEGCTAKECAPWHEVTTQLAFGRAEIKRGTIGFGIPGADGGTDIYVVGFVGKREGGSPRVELPKRAE